MTGPEHYRMAETLVKVADEGSVDWESTVATAQVHATLALAAATALVMGDNGHTPIAEYDEWSEVASTAAARRREAQS